MDTYRGYAGQSQRTYLDPDLISSLTITKGPSLQANASGGIGGVVEMETLKIDDVLREGRDFGVRVRGGLANASANDLPSYSAAPRSDRSATGSQFFNVAAAGHWDRFDLVAAHAYRDNGNYFSGKHGYDDFPQTRRTLAPLNPPRTEVFNTSARSKSALLRAPAHRRCADAGSGLPPLRRHRRRDHGVADHPRRPRSHSAVGPGPCRHGQLHPALPLQSGQRSGRPACQRHIHRYRQRDVQQPDRHHPWYFDRRTEWYDAPSFSGDPGYKDAYRNPLRQKRFGLDASNTSMFDTRAGAFTLDYGLSYSDEDIAPGSSGPVMHDDRSTTASCATPSARNTVPWPR